MPIANARCVHPSHGAACSADFGGEQEQPVEQVRGPSNLLTLTADEQVEEQPPSGAESEAAWVSA